MKLIPDSSRGYLAGQVIDLAADHAAGWACVSIH
jgi:hypothetical protein